MAQASEVADEKEPIHVLDLPQLYQKPSAAALNDALNLLGSSPTGFTSASDDAPKVSPEGTTRYLTSIISNPLAWLPNDSTRENIWERASTCLAQRSGRTAMGDLTRTFEIPLSGGRTLNISLREPGLTGDDLGHKTWASSFVLAKALHTGLRVTLPSAVFYDESRFPRVLELGAGTGLVGLVAAAVWRTRVVLTDLPEICENLEFNVQTNGERIRKQGGRPVSGTLDWRRPDCLRVGGDVRPEYEKFSVILAADPIYSPEHPQLLVEAVNFWLAKEKALLILAYPLREVYSAQIEELERRASEMGLVCWRSLEEQEMDDWKDVVNHRISVWCWK